MNNNVIPIRSKQRLEIATQFLAGMLSDWTTLSNAQGDGRNTWREASKTALCKTALWLADILIEENEK